MGRRSLAKERRAQILDVFAECILEKGLDGASIAAIAEVAGMDRTLVHHYFGNRTALEAALVERLLEVYKRDRDAAVALLPLENRSRALLDYLFSPKFGNPRFGILFDELFSASNRSPSTQALLLRAYEEFEQNIRAEIEKVFPRAPTSRRRQVAYSIMCLAETASRFARLGFPEARRRSARASAEALLQTLEVPSTT